MEYVVDLRERERGIKIEEIGKCHKDEFVV